MALKNYIDQKRNNKGNRKPQQKKAVVTLPDGTEVGLPDYILNSPTRLQTRQNSRDIFLRYEQPDWQYIGNFDTSPGCFVQIHGTIYVDGQPSVNPDFCLVDINNNNINDVLEPWPGYPDGYPLDCTLHAVKGYYDPEGQYDIYFPNFSKETATRMSGNADAIAVIWNGEVQGWDFVNNQLGATSPNFGQPPNETMLHLYPESSGYGSFPIDGITLPFAWNDGASEHLSDYITPCETNWDLLYYKASTNTFHNLTDESRELLLNPVNNNINPVSFYNFTIFIAEPYASLYAEFHDMVPGNWGITEDWQACWGSNAGPPPYICGECENLVSIHPNHYVSFGPPLSGDDLTDILPGDVNLDNQVNVQDIVRIINMITVDLIPGEQIAQQYPQADMNGDGRVNVADIVAIIQIITGNPRTSESDRQELQRQLDRLHNNKKYYGPRKGPAKIPPAIDSQDYFSSGISDYKQPWQFEDYLDGEEGFTGDTTPICDCRVNQSSPGAPWYCHKNPNAPWTYQCGDSWCNSWCSQFSGYPNGNSNCGSEQDCWYACASAQTTC